jgi:hypothetical protein
VDADTSEETPTETEIERDIAEQDANDAAAGIVDDTPNSPLPSVDETEQLTPPVSSTATTSTTTTANPTAIVTTPAPSLIPTPAKPSAPLQRNYCNNFVSIPVLHQTKLCPEPQPTSDAREAEKEEFFSQALDYFIGAIDSRGRNQLTNFLESLRQPATAVDKRKIKSATPPTPIPTPTAATTAITQPAEETQTSSPSLASLDNNILNEISEVEDTELTQEEIQHLRFLKEKGFDVDFLDSLLTLTTTPPSTPPTGMELDNSNTPSVADTTPQLQPTTTIPSQSSASTSSTPSPLPSPSPNTKLTSATKGITPLSLVPVEQSGAKVAQKILDRNFELLCNLQLCQYERPASGVSEGEFNFATELSNNLVQLAGYLQPQQMVSKESIFNTLQFSGLQSVSAAARNKS